jgi:succinate dehydrogenase flavin-adding protein (antitoxin of CptAB toxin-antitoxin module)
VEPDASLGAIDTTRRNLQERQREERTLLNNRVTKPSTGSSFSFINNNNGNATPPFAPTPTKKPVMNNSAMSQKSSLISSISMQAPSNIQQGRNPIRTGMGWNSSNNSNAFGGFGNMQSMQQQTMMMPAQQMNVMNGMSSSPMNNNVMGVGMTNSHPMMMKETSPSLNGSMYFEKKWMEMYNRLVAYNNIHGNTRVPTKYKKDPNLAHWVGTQRRSCKRTDRIDLLNEIGFEWRLQHNHDWMVMYKRLVAYKQKHNNTRLSKGYKEDPKLSNWVHAQRRCCKDKDRVELLNKIGFEWKLVEREDWIVMYKRLVAYKQKHNNTSLPKGDKEDPKLSNWVHTQRHCCKDKDRVELLNKIGFDWKVREKGPGWMGMYKRLVAYKQKHNTTRVPYAYKEDPKLANWVSRQRQAFKVKDGKVKNRKVQDRIDLLNEIGFEWTVRQNGDWMIMYKRLVAYQKKHNTTRVPHGYKEDPKLANWVHNQRSNCEDKDRTDLLNKIGFAWAKKNYYKNCIII